MLPTWAEELGAAVAQLEHRFFGVSYPRKYGELHERYASLTLDNVLDDSVGFLQWLGKSNASLAQAPIIATGGVLLNILMYHTTDKCNQAHMVASCRLCCALTIPTRSTGLLRGQVLLPEWARMTQTLIVVAGTLGYVQCNVQQCPD